MMMPQTTESKAAAVLDLYRQGLWPIPNWWPLSDGRCACGKPTCDSPGKHPIPTWKPYEHRAPTETEVRNWLKNYPDANWGIVLGEAARVIVVDLDGAGAEGLLLDAGIEPPACATWRSPGGAKILLRHPGGPFQKKIRLLKADDCGVDLLADGSQVVVPPSRHYTGGIYEWVIPLGEGIADAPAALLAFAWATSPDNGKSPHPPAAPIGPTIPDGQRDVTLTSLAGSMRRRGASSESILAALRVENAKCVPHPKPDADLRRIARSVGDGHRALDGPGKRAASGAELRGPVPVV